MWNYHRIIGCAIDLLVQVPHTMFPGDASRWMLDFKDLTLIRKIGEGAFGKVYLGRWQETEVAIKMLTSLQTLGLPSADSAEASKDTSTLF